MDLGIAGKTVLVTGASGDLGQAMAQLFAAEGARVAVGFHHRENQARAVAAAITASGGTATTVRIDHRDPTSPPPDRRPHRAGTRPRRHPGRQRRLSWPTARPETRDTLTDALTANTVGPLALAEAVLPGMRQAGRGRLVFLSSDVVAQPLPAAVAYPTAKAALETAAKVLAAREARHGILTNVVRPPASPSPNAPCPTRASVRKPSTPNPPRPPPAASARPTTSPPQWPTSAPPPTATSTPRPSPSPAAATSPAEPGPGPRGRIPQKTRHASPTALPSPG